MYWLELGFSIIPTHRSVKGRCSCGKVCESPGKHPIVAWKKWQSEKASRDQLESWFSLHPDANLSVITGSVSGNVMVLDVDENPEAGKYGMESLHDLIMEEGDLPETLTQITGSGGRHLFYRFPQNLILPTDSNWPLPYLDVRGEGGYVVAAPSIHPNGIRYKLDNPECPIALAPDWMISLVEQKQPASGKSRSLVTRTPTPEASINQFGQIIDGRQGYSVKLITGALKSWYEDQGEIPEAEDLLAEIWPTWEMKVATRSPGGLESEGRGKQFLKEKIEYYLKRARAGSLDVINETEPGAGRPETTESQVVMQSYEVSELNYWSEEFRASIQFAEEPPPIDWLVQDMIPMGVPGLLNSMGGVGKSFLLMDLALKIAGGDAEMHQEYWLGHLVQNNGPVLFLTTEDGRHVVNRRMRSFGDLFDRAKRNLWVLTQESLGYHPLLLDDREGLRLGSGMKKLIDQAGYGQPKLIVLDPLQKFVLADLNKPEVAQFYYVWIQEVCNRAGCPVLTTHHNNKVGYNVYTVAETRSAVRGSSALVDGARLCMGISLVEPGELGQICSALGLEYQIQKVVKAGISKSNELADLGERYLVRSEDGILVDKTGEVEGILQNAKSLDRHEKATLISEMKRRRSGDAPFCRSANSPRSIIRYMTEKFSMTPRGASSVIDSLITSGEVREQYDSKLRMKVLEHAH